VDHEYVLGDDEVQAEHAVGGAKQMHHEMGDSSRAVPKEKTVNFVTPSPTGRRRSNSDAM
jgi:hypothetical protein